MQGNINIPDSTITSELTFRHLVLMNMQQLTNFPYIEKDFDALTDYELLCLVVKYLNDVINNQNEQNDSITNMYNAFLALQTYVNNTKDEVETAFNNLDDFVRNYFENLDVQDEINNKLDAMADSGQLTDIIAQYLGLAGMIAYDSVSDMKLAQNLVNGSKCHTLGYYSANDGGESIYKIRTKTNEDVIDEISIIALYDESLIAELVVFNNQINILQGGCIGDSETDNTTKLQTIMNICCDNNYVLYIPTQRFLVTDSIDIKSSINIKGDGNSSYKATSEILCDFGTDDTPLFTSTTTLSNTPPRCTFENVKFQRIRTESEGFPDNLQAIGLYGICFGFKSNESVFNRCCVMGFGAVFTNIVLTTCQECDFIYCNSIIRSSSIVTAVNIVSSNLYGNGLLFDISGSIQNLNITDTWIEDFVSLLKNYHQPVQNFNVTNCVLTNTAHGENYLVYDNTTVVFTRQFYNFVNSVLYIKNNICDGTPSSTEFEMRLINCSVLYGGTGETINIVGNSKFMNLSSQNINSLNTKGFDFSNNLSYSPLKFREYTSLPDKTLVGETGLYYNSNSNGKRLEYFNNSNYRNLIIPTVINTNTNDTAPPFTPTCMTIAINQSLFGGDSLGWIYHNATNTWVRLPQIGNRSWGDTPVSNLTPKFVGELVFDYTHSNWYISTGTTDTDWKIIT